MAEQPLMSVTAAVHDALRLALRDLAGATGALAEIERRHGTAVVSIQLEELAVALWSHLGRRSYYPIPIEHVLGWLHDDDGDDRGEVTFLLRIAGERAAPDDEARDELIGAFEATTALIRFASARWWVRPGTVLDRVTQVGGEAPPAVTWARTGTPLARR